MNKVRYYSLKEFSKRQKAFSYHSLRGIRTRCLENGFESAFIKSGKRVVIDEAEFWKCAKSKSKPVVRKQ